MEGRAEGLTSEIVREKLGEQMGAAVERLEAQAAEARELKGQVKRLKANVQELSEGVDGLSEEVKELAAVAEAKTAGES
jgi:hypothetical protein